MTEATKYKYLPLNSANPVKQHKTVKGRHRPSKAVKGRHRPTKAVKYRRRHMTKMTAQVVGGGP